MAAVTCPTVNSYKRFGVGAPQSGATWAPAYATYGGNNRTQMLRVPEGGRVENRGCDGSANPYLAMAVAAGRRARRHRPRPGPGRAEPRQPARRCRPRTSPRAASGRCRRPCCTPADELVTDDVLREALGKTPDGDYIDYYARSSATSSATWHSGVSDWEVERYLTLF